MKNDIFISYSRKDSALVDKFYRALIELGYTVWIDKEGIFTGDAFKRVIVRAIKEARCVVFFSSLYSNSSPWTTKELSVAVNNNIPIIPVKLDMADYNEDVEFDLAPLDYIDFRDESTRSLLIDRFCQSVLKKVPLSEKLADTEIEENLKALNTSYKEAMDYYTGENGKKPNIKKAFSLFKRAALNGHAEAQVYVGLCYEKGYGTSKDEKEAFKWYLSSAEQNCQLGMSRVSSCYNEGIGVEKDMKKAAEWAKKFIKATPPGEKIKINISNIK